MLSTSDPMIDDTTERLAHEFAGVLAAGIVATVVRGSRQDLDSSSPAALPELVERLARQRLIDALPARDDRPAL